MTVFITILAVLNFIRIPFQYSVAIEAYPDMIFILPAIIGIVNCIMGIVLTITAIELRKDK